MRLQSRSARTSVLFPFWRAVEISDVPERRGSVLIDRRRGRTSGRSAASPGAGAQRARRPTPPRGGRRCGSPRPGAALRTWVVPGASGAGGAPGAAAGAVPAALPPRPGARGGSGHGAIGPGGRCPGAGRPPEDGGRGSARRSATSWSGRSLCPRRSGSRAGQPAAHSARRPPGRAAPPAGARAPRSAQASRWRREPVGSDIGTSSEWNGALGSS